MKLFPSIPIATLLLAPLLGSCGEPPTAVPEVEHYPALAQGLAEAEAAVAESAKDAPEWPEVEPEHVAGLVHMLASSRGRTRELPMEEIGTLGDGATPFLAVIAANSEHDAAERMAACELLAGVATPLATEHLLQLLERSTESWVRAQAAWRLGSVGQEWVIPRVLRRFKYEKDEQTVIWMASTLSGYGNHTGLDVLWRLSEQATSEKLRNTAIERLNTLATEAGLENPRQHWDLWFVNDPEGRLRKTSPSPRLLLAAWREIEQLSGEHFQLRGVDESRFVLSRLGAWVTEPLCRALNDEDVYVRVHAAQCLERMGPRAVDAGPALLDALADPTLANQAAAALGAVAYPSAEPVLRRLLEEEATDHELRVACAASLGSLGVSASIPSLRDFLEGNAPFDLRQTAAASLVRMGSGEEAARFLFEALSDPAADQPGAEISLESWIQAREAEDAERLLKSWEALGPPPGIIHTPAQARKRREARQLLLEKSGLF